VRRFMDSSGLRCRRIAILALMAALLAGATTACGEPSPPTPQQQVASVCAEVRKKVDALPAGDPSYDTMRQQLVAAHDADVALKKIAEIERSPSYKNLTESWSSLVSQMNDMTWALRQNNVSGALAYAGATEAFSGYKASIRQYSDEYGVLDCGAVPWRGGEPSN
jgi:hypothetical protein